MLFLAALVALAGNPDSTLIKRPESVRIAIPKVAQRPVLDGKLDDSTWAQAAQLTDFVEYEPNDLVRGREKSIAYVAYDSQYLFLAFRAFESKPGNVRATVFPRERGGDYDDRVTFELDTYLDKRRALEFKSNPYGIQTDGIKVEGLVGDPSPDYVWYSAGRVDDKGWTVEMMIPLGVSQISARGSALHRLQRHSRLRTLSREGCLGCPSSWEPVRDLPGRRSRRHHRNR